MAGGEWIDCQFIRFLQRNECVIRILDSGAYVHVGLVEPLDLTRACVVSALHPAPARVRLGPFSKGCYQGCNIQVVWRDNHIRAAPPARFVRRIRKQQTSHMKG